MKEISNPVYKYDEETHPCFSATASNYCARVHLPVAPRCNILCNYCNRSYDCINESRPGVASRIISPAEALSKVKESVSQFPNLSTAAISGPGDSLANPVNTFETLRLIRHSFTNLNLCISTNGLKIIDYYDEIVNCGITHISITINSLDERIASKIYSSVEIDGRVLSGVEAGRTLIERQIKGIDILVSQGIAVKVNSVVIPGLNDKHLPLLAQILKKKGVSTINFIPLIPLEGTKFENLSICENFYNNFLKTIPPDILLMKHCRRCRSDAEGYLDEESDNKHTCAQRKPYILPYKGVKIAAAGSRKGIVDKHFGKVESFFIYRINNDGRLDFIENRNIERFCTGKANCAHRREEIERIASILSDCKILLCSSAGAFIMHLFRKKGIKILFAYGRVDEIFKNLLS